MGEKERILLKLNRRDYKNELELILENKEFDEEAKSLILSIFYKIDNFYKDYIDVKKETETKNKYLEEYINIINNKCNKIKILSPKECTKTKKYIIDKKNGEIRCFPNEVILLYAIYELNEISEIGKLKNLTVNCMINMLNKGKTINSIEPIRDFNGWSWNVEISDSKNIEYNLIYQNLLILFGYNFVNELMNNELRNMLKKIEEEVINKDLGEKGKEITTSLFELAVILYNNSSVENHKKCLKYKSSILGKINVLNNRKDFIDIKTKNNLLVIKKIQKMDVILNDINLIKKQYEKSLKTEECRYLCISDFVDNMEKDREKLLKIMNKNNNLLSPKEFLKTQEENQKKLNLYNSVKEEQNKISLTTKLINFELLFLECMETKIEKTNNRKDLFNIVLQLRYFTNLPYKKDKKIISNEKVNNKFEEVIRKLINKIIGMKCIDTGFKLEELNYKILKYIFKTKMIKLDNLVIKISFKTKDEIQVEYFDSNMLDYNEDFEIPFEEEVINRKDKKIKFMF